MTKSLDKWCVVYFKVKSYLSTLIFREREMFYNTNVSRDNKRTFNLTAVIFFKFIYITEISKHVNKRIATVWLLHCFIIIKSNYWIRHFGAKRELRILSHSNDYYACGWEKFVALLLAKNNCRKSSVFSEIFGPFMKYKTSARVHTEQDQT